MPMWGTSESGRFASPGLAWCCQDCFLTTLVRERWCCTIRRVSSNPFYLLAPHWALYPLVGLATAATVIASQALISGAFSLTIQAIQLGYLPRMAVKHTSSKERGQIYLPHINWALMLACIGLVLGFQSSSNMAAAYGVAVTMTMLSTTVLFFFAARRLWGWSAWRAALTCSLFLVVETAFFAANLLKVLTGGWFPLAMGLAIFTAHGDLEEGARAGVEQAPPGLHAAGIIPGGH